MPIHAYIIPIHIYTHTHAHTSIYIYIYIYIHLHTRIAVHVYIAFRLLMEGGMVRVYRILRVMPQPAINIAKICFVTNYGQLRNYNFLNNNILYHLLGGIYGPLTCHSKSQLGPCTITFPERNGDPTTSQSDCLTVTPMPLHIAQVTY